MSVYFRILWFVQELVRAVLSEGFYLGLEEFFPMNDFTDEQVAMTTANPCSGLPNSIGGLSISEILRAESSRISSGTRDDKQCDYIAKGLRCVAREAA